MHLDNILKPAGQGVTPARPWRAHLEGVRATSFWKQILAIVGYGLLGFWLFAALVTLNGTYLVFALEVLGLSWLAFNAWGLRTTLPVVSSSDKRIAAGGWIGLTCTCLVLLGIATPSSPRNPAAAASASMTTAPDSTAVLTQRELSTVDIPHLFRARCARRSRLYQLPVRKFLQPLPLSHNTRAQSCQRSACAPRDRLG